MATYIAAHAAAVQTRAQPALGDRVLYARRAAAVAPQLRRSMAALLQHGLARPGPPGQSAGNASGAGDTNMQHGDSMRVDAALMGTLAPATATLLQVLLQQCAL